MSVALHGNLSDFGIAEVFQLIGQQRKTGTLRVDGEGSTICLAFDKGRVVRGGSMEARSEREPLGLQLVRAGYLTRDQLTNLERESARSARPIPDLLLAAGLIERETLAEVQHLLTRETVFEVMRRQNGDFHFTAEPVQHDTPPEKLLGAEQILMDGLRMLDEWQTFREIVPSPDLVFRRVGQLEGARSQTPKDAGGGMASTERVLQLVDGRLPVRRIIDLSRIGTFEATRALAELRQTGVIELVEVSKTERAAEPVRKRVRLLPMGQLLRVALGTALPFVALAWIGTAAMARTQQTLDLPGTRIPDPLVAQLGLRHQTRLIRNLIETRYFETGRYPEDLSEIAPRLAEAGSSLTASQLGDYYYRVRDDEVILLAPLR
jgi:hypothetical protein